MRFDPELGKFTRQHIYGEGMMDMFKSFGNKIFGKTMKKAAKKSGEKLLTMSATETGEYSGKKAGDKIVQMLNKEKDAPSKKSSNKKVTFNKNVETMTQKEIDQTMNNLLSGGSTRKRKLYNY